MKKKILAILMATLTVGSLLSGCGGAQSGDAAGKQESGKQESSDSEEPAEVVFAYMTQNNIPESSELERIQNLINDYTVDKINTKVKLVLFSNSDYMNQVNLMLASGEQLDLFQAYNTSHLKYIQDGTALDITEYLDNDLKETTETLYDGFLAPTTATTAELLMSGNCFGTFCGLGNPKIAQQYTNNYGHPFENVQISDSMIWSGNGGAWMVNSGCKDPSAACKFMNLLYTDAYVDNLLVYGEEGVDYKLDENGCAVAPDGYTDLNSVAYTNNMNYYFWGNKWLTYPVAGGLYGEEKETNKQQNYDGDHSNYYGFLYDYSDKEAEYTACQNIVEEYKKSLWVGAADVDTTLAEMTKRLKAAGMDDLIQAKQEQLDAWMSSK